MAKKIQLTRGKFTTVDDFDYDWLSQWKWTYDKGYAYRFVQTGKILMHRLILNTRTEGG